MGDSQTTLQKVLQKLHLEQNQQRKMQMALYFNLNKTNNVRHTDSLLNLWRKTIPLSAAVDLFNYDVQLWVNNQANRMHFNGEHIYEIYMNRNISPQKTVK